MWLLIFHCVFFIGVGASRKNKQLMTTNKKPSGINVQRLKHLLMNKKPTAQLQKLQIDRKNDELYKVYLTGTSIRKLSKH